MRFAALAAILVLATAPARAQEDPTVRQLRSMLPAGATLTFGRATPITGGPAQGVTLENVVLTQRNERTTIGSLTLVGLRPDGIVRLNARDVAAATPTGPLRMASLEVTGLAVRRRPAGQDFQPDDMKLSTLVVENLAGSGRPDFTLARITLNNWGIGRRTEGEITGMSFSGIPDNPIDAVTVARLAVSGPDLASLTMALTQRQAPATQPAGRQTVVLEGVVMRGGGVTLGGLESLTIEGDTDVQGSGNGRLALRGLTAERAPPTAAFFDQVGLDRLDASLSFEGTYDAATGRLVLPAFALGVRQLGAIALALGIDGYTPQAAQTNDVSRMRLLDARLRYADQSLYSRAVRSQAQRTGTTEQAVRDQYAQMVGATLSSGTSNPALDGLREVLMRFIRGEITTVEIDARPTAPVPFTALGQTAQQGPAPLVRQLGITATGR